MPPPASCGRPHGRIVFDGRDITRLPPHRRARLGISRTFQITNLFPTLSVADNMALAVRGLEPRKFSLFGSPELDGKEAAAIERGARRGAPRRIAPMRR